MRRILRIRLDIRGKNGVAIPRVCVKMNRQRCAQLSIVLALVFGCEIALSQRLDLFEDRIIVDLNETTECDAHFECIKDSCNEGRVCIMKDKKLIQFGTITCDEKSKTPYCNDKNGDVCSKTPRPGCNPSTFACPTATGVYPDPTDCRTFHKCVDFMATTNTCPSKFVYNHETGGCKFQRYSTDCVIFNCRLRERKPILYPRDDRIYGQCIFGKPYILGRCKDYERYDTVQEKCVRHCRTAGFQPPDDPKTCWKYVQCIQVSLKKYEPVTMSCACNEGYNEEKNACVAGEACLETVPQPWCKKAGKNDKLQLFSHGEWKGSDDDDGDSSGNDTENDDSNEYRGESFPLIINNAGSSNKNNSIANGNDDVDGNLVNGNNNGNNVDSGNIVNKDASPLIINNSGNSNNNNSVSNGDDNVNGNLVNGNNNGDNSNSGNVANSASVASPLIINNSGNNNANNDVSNGDDNVNGNLVNGNNNGNNSGSGNVVKKQPESTTSIINNSGNSNNNSNVRNGNDDVNGNLVNGNNNCNNRSSGNVQRRSLPLIINNSGNGNSDNDLVNDNNNGNNDNSDNVENNDPMFLSKPNFIINNSGHNNSDNNVSNGNDDIDGNLVNGNNNGNNNNSGNIARSESMELEDSGNKQPKSLISIIIEWIINIILGGPNDS